MAILFLLLAGSARRGFCGEEQESVTVHAPRVQKIELLNGLKILVIEKKPAQAATVVSLLIKTGFLADPKDREGTAFLTAEAVRSANGKVPAERWKDELEFLGAQVEIRVNADATVFQAQLPPTRLEVFLAFLANVVLRPVFAVEGLERIKLETHASRVFSSASFYPGRALFRQTVFDNSRCSRSGIGTAESLKGIRIADLELFHRSYYLPNNSALVVVGPPSEPRIDSLVREKFGGWVKGSLASSEPAVGFPSLSGQKVRVVESGTHDDAATILLGHPAPARQTPDYFPLQLVAAILGNTGKSSRLEQALTAQNVPYRSISSEVQFERDCSQFQIVANVPVASLQTAIQTILDGIESMKTVPISESEMSAAKAKLLAEYAAVIESDARIADQVAEIELFDLARDFLTEYSGRVEQTAAERVEEAAKNYLSSTRVATVIVGDGKAVTSALAGFRTPDIVGDTEPHVPPASSK